MADEREQTDYPGHPETGTAPQPTGPEDPDELDLDVEDLEDDPAYNPEDEELKDIKGG